MYLSTNGTKPSQEEVTYTYTPSGAIAQIEYLGNTVITHDYDIRGRLTDINNIASTSNTPFAAQYNYKKNSRINWASFWNPNVDTNFDLDSDHFKYTYDYTYDNPGRLTSADYQPDGPTSNAFDLAGITYDANGNILSMQRRGASEALIDNMSYSYTNANNQLTAITDAAGQVHGWDGASGSFTYDFNGNLTAMTGNPSISNIAYDHRNLSIHTYLAGDIEQIANYNAEGQRILKEVQTPGGTTWDFYVRDGLSTLAVISNGELQFMNLFGNGLMGRVEANNGAISASGTKRYYIADLLGSVRAVVDETGDVKENRDYDPWGVPMDQRQYVKGVDKALEQFSGQELDEQTGWYHFGQRDLMAIYGRWPSPDRFADKYPSHSPYSYAANDPIGIVDVNGDSLDVRHLDQETLNWLTSQLATITGLTLSVSESGMLIVHPNAEVNTDGTSETARNDLMYAIGHEAIYSVFTTEGRTTTDDNGRAIYFNTEDIRFGEENSINVSPLTMGIGMTFLHELNHTSIVPSGRTRDDGYMGVGRTVIHMNKIRYELNRSNWDVYNGMSLMGHRFQYGHEEDQRGLYIPFSRDGYQRVYRRIRR